VKIQYSNKYQSANCNFHWLKKPILSGRYRSLLQDNGSLTKLLKQRYKDFKVKPTQVGYGKPFVDEMSLLKQAPRNVSLLREVFLMGNHQAVVFAHSVMPCRILRGLWVGLGCIGNKPLGESLFGVPRVTRMALSYKKLARQHPLYQRAIPGMNEQPAYLWARRSVFSLHGAKIMVTEVLLPQILL